MQPHHQQQRPIMLFDMSNATHRIYHRLRYANPNRAEPDARAVGSTVLEELGNRAGKLRAADSIAVFDGAQGVAYRRALFAGYKSKSGERPKVVSDALDYLRRTLPARGFRIEEFEWFEADDVLGALADQAGARNHRTIIAAGDWDLAQCISPHVSLLWTGAGPRAGRLIELPDFYEEFDYPPCRVADQKALAGDRSDSLDGVPGIGDGYANHLVREWGGLEKIYANLGAVEAWNPKVASLLIQYRDHAWLMRSLTKLRTEVPVRLY